MAKEARGILERITQARKGVQAHHEEGREPMTAPEIASYMGYACMASLAYFLQTLWNEREGNKKGQAGEGKRK